MLIVKADNGKSSEDEGARGLGFRILPENESRRVKDAVKRLERLGLPDEARLYAAALLYLGNELTAEAIDILEPLVRGKARGAGVFLTLGECYRKVGLVLPAEERYAKALALAKAAGDIEGQAMALEGLAEVFAMLGNAERMKESFAMARDGYKVLGDAKHAGELEERMGN